MGVGCHNTNVMDGSKRDWRNDTALRRRMMNTM